MILNLKIKKMCWRENSEIIRIVLLGIFIHILLVITVFDTYFKSPLEQGMTPVKSTESPPAKRLVLFSADGLRAEAILDENEKVNPYLTSIRRTRSSWGVSHTRVPTESRPGHVAMLAGIYEDPSAVFKGWKHNPVDFDSVINQSRNAWCFGSPDIVPIFNKDRRKHVFMYTYDGEMQDFGKKDTIALDRWVFEKTEWILWKLKESDWFKESGNVFFLHLLGLDTAGHGFKPYSREYIDNIKFVDENIKHIEKLFIKIFPDGLTSFIFTSDHGMTNWGSHGSGLDHETLTPIIAWGAGIKIDNVRNDIEQIDIAPLISSLLGLHYPSNNFGKLPIDYLSIAEKYKLHNFLTNIQQIFNIFNAKQQKIEQSLFFYKPYKDLTTDNFETNFTDLWHSNESFNIVIKKADLLFNEILKAVQYCHNYFMYYILFSVSLGLFFWILHLSTFLFDNKKVLILQEKKVDFIKIFILFYNFLVIFTCMLQSFPFSYYIYFLFPSSMLYFFLNRLEIFHLFTLKLVDMQKWRYFIFIYFCIICFIYGFQYRYCFSVMMILIALSIFLNPDNVNIRQTLKCSWIIVSCILSVFPMLPLMSTKFQIIYFILGFISWQFFSHFIIVIYFSKLNTNISMTSKQKKIFRLYKIAFNLSFIISLIISQNIFEYATCLKCISWILFLVPLSTILFSTDCLETRIFSIILSFGPFYIMTTMNYELIFLTFYCTLLTIWMKIEQNVQLVSNIEFENFRKCVIFVSMTLIGFFGTGNIASLNTFDPMWVRCFLTVFSPFTMAILIVLKLILPILFTACVFRYIVLKTGMNLKNSFCVILLISDIMVFYFMYHIKNEGSWLDIGISLSNFVVVNGLTVGIIVFYFVAFLLTNMNISSKILRLFLCTVLLFAIM